MKLSSARRQKATISHVFVVSVGTVPCVGKAFFQVLFCAVLNL